MPNFSTHLWVGRYYPLLGVMQTTSLLVVMISLMYVSLIVDIEKVFGIEIKLEELEECLSVKKLIEIAQAAWEKK